MEGKAQVHVCSIKYHHCCQPRHNQDCPRFLFPSFQPTITTRVLANVKCCKCRSDRVLALFKGYTPRQDCLERRPTLGSFPMKGMYDWGCCVRRTIDLVQEYRIVMFLALGQGVVLSRPL